MLKIIKTTVLVEKKNHWVYDFNIWGNKLSFWNQRDGNIMNIF